MTRTDRKALIVGIDHYEHLDELSGCVNDARSVHAMFERHADGDLNFVRPNLITGSETDRPVTTQRLRDEVRKLFAGSSEVALFYFAGHGHLDTTGGFLCTSRTGPDDLGLPLHDVMAFAHKSESRNKFIILDSCHSGAAADNALAESLAEISDGVTILTASTRKQYAYETEGGGAGVFTSLLVDALNGAAANLVGEVTPGAVYAHIDQSLGPWAQRPVFKTNVERFVSLRKVEAPIPKARLRKLTELFTEPEDGFQLDPSYEPERSGHEDASVPPPDPANTEKFAVLQQYARVNLVRPVDAPHMWHAAMQSKSCQLTALGHHYWRLVHKRLI